MLAAELALAVAPTAGRDDGRHPRVRSAGVDRHGGAEAAAHQGDALRVHVGAAGHIAHRAGSIRDLFEANDPPVLPLAIAAAAEVDAHRDVAPRRQLLGHDGLSVAALVAAETVEDDKRRAALAGAKIVRNVHDAGQF